MFDTSRIVGVFKDDDHPETYAVGIVNEEGTDLLLQVEDPTTIVHMAKRLMMFAEEIHQNEERGINEVIEKMKASGAKTMGEFAEMRRNSGDVIDLNEHRDRGSRC